MVHIDVAPEVFRILKARAAAEDRTLKSVVARAVRFYASTEPEEATNAQN